jgi:hypothetical protein
MTTDRHRRELSAEEQQDVERFVYRFLVLRPEAQARTFLMLEHLAQVEDTAPEIAGLDTLYMPDFEAEAARERAAVQAKRDACIALDSFAMKAELRALRERAAELDDILVDLMVDAEEARLAGDEPVRSERKRVRYRRKLVQRMKLKRVRELWSSLPKERHAKIASALTEIAASEPPSLETRVANDRFIARLAGAFETAMARETSASWALEMHRQSHPFTHNVRSPVRELERAVLDTAENAARAEYDLADAQRRRSLLHQRRVLLDRGIRGEAARVLPRQRSLGLDPERQLAFEAFCRDHEAGELSSARAGRELVVAKVQNFRDQPAFAVLETPKSRHGVDLRRYTFDSPPALGTRLTLQSGMKLSSSQASSAKSLSADSSAIGLGR